MDLIAQLCFLLAAFIVMCDCLPDESKPQPDESGLLLEESKSKPDESKLLPDPRVFEMPTPPGFMKFSPMNGKPEIGKFPFWATPIANIAENMKFPDWFLFSDNKPGTDIKLDKNKDNDSDEINPEANNVDGKETVYEFTYNDPHSKNFDAKDVFLSSAYPSWLAMPGFNGLTNKNKESDDIKIKPLKVSSEIQPNENKEPNVNGNDTVEKFSESPLTDDKNFKLSMVPDPYPTFFPKDEDVDVNKENKPNADKSFVSKLIRDNSKLVNVNKDGAVIVPVQVVPIQLSRINIPHDQNNKGSTILAPNSSDRDENTHNIASDSQKSTNQAQHNPIEITEVVKVISNVEDESEESNLNKERNLMPNNYLYNLLQQAKPVLSSISSDNKGSFPSNTQIAAMLFPSKNSPKPQGRSVMSGNNVGINNGDSMPIVDQTINEEHLSNNSPTNEALPNTFQNTNPQTFPTNAPEAQGNIPNNAGLNQPYIFNGNGNTPVNVPANNYAVPYGNVNQNNNYLQNPGQAVPASLPYNPNAPTNYVLVNPGNSQQWNGILNGQNIQSNGQGYPISSNNMALVYPTNNNMGYVSPGINPGQNVYAIVPIANGNVGNMNASPYVNSQPNPMYQVVGPLYNLVPVQQNSAVVNTKDEEE